MSCNENNNDTLSDEVIENKPTNKQYKPRCPKWMLILVGKSLCSRCSLLKLIKTKLSKRRAKLFRSL